MKFQEHYSRQKKKPKTLWCTEIKFGRQETSSGKPGVLRCWAVTGSHGGFQKCWDITYLISILYQNLFEKRLLFLKIPWDFSVEKLHRVSQICHLEEAWTLQSANVDGMHVTEVQQYSATANPIIVPFTFETEKHVMLVKQGAPSLLTSACSEGWMPSYKDPHSQTYGSKVKGPHQSSKEYRKQSYFQDLKKYKYQVICYCLQSGGQLWIKYYNNSV